MRPAFNETVDSRPRLDLAMPAHNEGASIAASLREWHAELLPTIALRFSVAEDGSKDNTREILRGLAAELPIVLDFADHRRGYAGGMIAALRATETKFVLTSDSDGQSDPKCFPQLWNLREDYDLVIGWRSNRADTTSRKIMSGAFRTLHRLLFGTRLHDPSCNVMLIRRECLALLLPKMGVISEGFQWELTARAQRLNMRIAEVRINHRPRASGGSVVFRPSRIPGIAIRNVYGLLRIWAGLA